MARPHKLHMGADDNRVGPDDVGTGRFRKLRAAIEVHCPVPAPAQGDPSDDELLRYLDGMMDGAERTEFELKLLDSPYASARVEILASALAECGWAPRSED